MAVVALAIGMVGPASATDAAGIGECSASTYATDVATCSMVPTGTSLYLSCVSTGGGAGRLSWSQLGSTWVVSCPGTFIGSILPGVAVTVTLSQTGGYAGWLDVHAISYVG